VLKEFVIGSGIVSGLLWLRRMRWKQLDVRLALLHSQVADQVHNTIHAVHGIHSITFHVPIVMLALSTVREGIKLIEGLADILSL
jgi:hypothetical protein